MTCLTALAVALVLGFCAPACANLQIQLSTNGTSWTEVAHDVSGGGALYGFPAAATFGGLRFTLLATTSNSPGSGTMADLFGSSLTVSNPTLSTKTVYFTLGDTGFTTPTTPPGFIQFSSNVGGSVARNNASNALVYQSYVDPANGQNSLTGGVTPGAQTPIITGIPGQSFNDSAFSTISRLTGPYSMTEYFKITLGAGSSFNFSSSTTLTLVPEPSSMAIAGLSMLGIVGYGVRRRRSA